jgi:hypothetical protein
MKSRTLEELNMKNMEVLCGKKNLRVKYNGYNS